MTSPLPTLNRDAALERLDGDTELYEEVVAVFLEDTPKQIEILRGALREGDLELARRQAHSLKSASAGIGAESLSAACFDAEKEFAGTAAAANEALFARIEEEFGKLQGCFP